MDRFRPLIPVMLLAALAGGLYGVAEALAVPVEARLWLESPWPLAVFGFFTTALLVMIPGGLIGLAGNDRLKGLMGGAAAITAFELVMMFITDPPPFQEPSWWMKNPALLGGGLLVTAGLVVASRKIKLVGAIWTVVLCAVPLMMGLTARKVASGVTGERPNLLVVTSDTTRADHIHAYGHKRISTPNIDRLAQEGVLFENAFSQIAVTGPSHTTIFTGQGTWSHGTLLNGIPTPAEERMVSEALSESGYRTGAFVSAYVLEARMGFDRGFATYDDDFSWLKGSSALMTGRLWAGIQRRIAPDAVLERRGGDTVDAALSWLDAAPEGQPWFLWVHLFDPHGPYEPPAPYDTMYYSGDQTDPKHDSMKRVKNTASYLEESLEGVTDLSYVIAQYDGEISYMDEQVGRLLNALDTRGEAGETLVVFSGDHGESLGENDVWFNHGDDVYDPSTHVPLVMRFPGNIPAGERVSGIAELTDIAPTIYDLMAMPIPEDIDGYSLTPHWTADRGRGYARSMIFDREANIADREAGRSDKPQWRMAGLRSDSTLFVYRDSPEFLNALYELDDQEKDVIGFWHEDDDKSSALDHLEGIAQGLLESGEEGAERSSQEISDEDRELLEQLGYME